MSEPDLGQELQHLNRVLARMHSPRRKRERRKCRPPRRSRADTIVLTEVTPEIKAKLRPKHGPHISAQEHVDNVTKVHRAYGLLALRNKMDGVLETRRAMPMRYVFVLPCGNEALEQKMNRWTRDIYAREMARWTKEELDRVQSILNGP